MLRPVLLFSKTLRLTLLAGSSIAYGRDVDVEIHFPSLAEALRKIALGEVRAGQASILCCRRCSPLPPLCLSSSRRCAPTAVPQLPPAEAPGGACGAAPLGAACQLACDAKLAGNPALRLCAAAGDCGGAARPWPGWPRA